jgi:hypothetical protein
MHSQVAREGTTLPRSVVGIVVVLPSVIALLLHVRFGLGYPLPTNDEARFLVPAWALAHNHSFNVPLANAPHGIFWVPHGFYVIHALLGSPFTWTLTHARWASFVGVQIFYVGLLVVASRRRFTWTRRGIAIVAVAFCVSNVALRAGNQARMEALVLAFFGLACIAVAFERYLAALAPVLLACTLHPVAIVAAIATTILLIVRRRHYRRTKGEYVLVGAALLLVGIEGGYDLWNLSLVRAQLSYQTSRKEHHALLFPQRLIAFTETVVAVGMGYLAWRVRALVATADQAIEAVLLPLCLAAGTTTYVFTTGYEWAYAVYIFGAAPALLFVAGATLLEGVTRPSEAALPSVPVRSG